MTWEPMTLDEYAELQKATGEKIVKIQGIWWSQPRPFFFRPLFPFTEIVPQWQNHPPKSLFGGVVHLVPADAYSNSCLNMFLYESPKDYALEKLGAKHRWTIKKAKESFSAKRITSLEQFLEEAPTIYHSFYDRTKYFYKPERLNKDIFAAWAKPYFANSKVVILGAYHGDKLGAIDISYQVEDVLIDDIFFSDTESQSLQVTDFMIHTLREAAKSINARYLFRGFPSGKATLDASKALRGCKLLKMPAYFRINPMALFLSKIFMKQSYDKLTALVTFPEQ